MEIRAFESSFDGNFKYVWAGEKKDSNGSLRETRLQVVVIKTRSSDKKPFNIYYIHWYRMDWTLGFCTKNVKIPWYILLVLISTSHWQCHVRASTTKIQNQFFNFDNEILLLPVGIKGAITLSLLLGCHHGPWETSVFNLLKCYYYYITCIWYLWPALSFVEILYARSLFPQRESIMDSTKWIIPWVALSNICVVDKSWRIFPYIRVQLTYIDLEICGASKWDFRCPDQLSVGTREKLREIGTVPTKSWRLDSLHLPEFALTLGSFNKLL